LKIVMDKYIDLMLGFSAVAGAVVVVYKVLTAWGLI